MTFFFGNLIRRKEERKRGNKWKGKGGKKTGKMGKRDFSYFFNVAELTFLALPTSLSVPLSLFLSLSLCLSLSISKSIYNLSVYVSIDRFDGCWSVSLS